MAMPGAIPTSTKTKPYDETVTITLSSCRRTQDAVRHIVLHPDEPIIIGRSSRSEFKNLSSSNDNALFDCPVVSRSHARFELTFNKWDARDMYKVYIVDTGSMHGTSVNGQKLQPNRRFLLNVGDIIRLGDSVAQGPNSYEGVMITLECISVASLKESTQAKSSQRGISCPSEPDSDSDSDDESVLEVEPPSSAQTTPDQAAEKPAMKKLTKLGSSILTGIVLEDQENEPESVIAPPTITARSIMVPDTYDEDSYDAPDNAPDLERRLAFDNVFTDYPRAATDEQQEMDEEEDAFSGAEDSVVDFSGDDQSQISSNDDNTSDAGSSHHSFDSEPNSMSHFQDDEDEHEWTELNDMHSIHDDQDDEEEEEEGPETMSSKRAKSVELGGAHPDLQYQTSDVPPREAAVPTRSHYDPVRGMFQVAPAPFTDNARTARSYDLFPPPSYSGVYANAWDSSKWDVGPNDMIMSHDSLQPVGEWQDAEIGGRPTFGEQTYPSQSAWSSPRHQPVFAEVAQEHDQDLPSMPNLSDSGKKRKASEISTSFVPMATAPESQPPSANVPQMATMLSLSELDQLYTSSLPDEPLVVEPPSKKLKTVQPRTKKSMLRAAAVEASKYTAGAIIGSIGLVTLLASPIGEALASC